jgi:hypothetical protein
MEELKEEELIMKKLSKSNINYEGKVLVHSLPRFIPDLDS